MNSYKNFVIIQSPISIPLALHLDVAHVNMIRDFSSISHGSE